MAVWDPGGLEYGIYWKIHTEGLSEIQRISSQNEWSNSVITGINGSKIILFPLRLIKQLPRTVTADIVWITTSTTVNDLNAFLVTSQLFGVRSYHICLSGGRVLVDNDTPLIHALYASHRQSHTYTNLPYDLYFHEVGNHKIVEGIAPLHYRASDLIQAIHDIAPLPFHSDHIDATENILTLHGLEMVFTELDKEINGNEKAELGIQSFHVECASPITCKTQQNMIAGKENFAILEKEENSHFSHAIVRIKYKQPCFAALCGTKLEKLDVSTSRHNDSGVPIFISPDGTEIYMKISEFGIYRIKQETQIAESLWEVIKSEPNLEEKVKKEGKIKTRDFLRKKVKEHYGDRGGWKYFAPAGYSKIDFNISQNKLQASEDWAVAYTKVPLDEFSSYIKLPDTIKILNNCDTINKSVSEVTGGRKIEINEKLHTYNNAFIVTPSYYLASTWCARPCDHLSPTTYWVDTRHITPQGNVVIALLQVRVNINRAIQVEANQSPLRGIQCPSTFNNGVTDFLYDRNNEIEWRLTNSSDWVSVRIVHATFSNINTYNEYINGKGSILVRGMVTRLFKRIQTPGKIFY